MDANPFLSGPFAPQLSEVDVTDLPIQGTLPADLQGAYIRNGPNPFYAPEGYTFPFDGDGMLHAIYLQEGKARYRNRFIKTGCFQTEQREGRSVYSAFLYPKKGDVPLKPTDNPGPMKNGSFIHIIRHASQYITCLESTLQLPYKVTSELETLGTWDAQGQLTAGMNAHTKVDPITGELYYISYSINKPPYLYCGMIDASGKQKFLHAIDIPYSVMMHDFVITQNNILFFVCPAVININAVYEADGKNKLLTWRPDLPTLIGIMPRKGTPKDISWISTDSFFVYHFMNAYEEEEKIIIDYIWRDGFMVSHGSKEPSNTLFRMEISAEHKILRNEQIFSHHIEFPRIRETLTGLSYQYGYVAGQKDAISKGFDTVYQYDVQNKSFNAHYFGSHSLVGEPIFAPKKEESAESKGYVLVLVHDFSTDQSSLLILDGENIDKAPIASVQLPQRVPFGLHGSWFSSPL